MSAPSAFEDPERQVERAAVASQETRGLRETQASLAMPGTVVTHGAVVTQVSRATHVGVANEVAGAPGREEDAKQRLIAAAGPVFAKHGFDRATVREICRKASVNVAAVGYHFGDKFGLYREVIRAIRTRCHSPQMLAAPADLSPQDELHYHIALMLRQMLSGDDTGWESQLLMREMNHPTGVFTEMVEESFRPHFERLKSVIERLSPPDTAIEVIERLTLSIVGQCLYYRVGGEVVKQLIPEQRRRDAYDIDSLARHITGVILAAAEQSLALKLGAALQPVQLPTSFRKATP